MPERTLRYIYESEDRSSAVLESLGASAGFADDAFENLTARIQAFDGAAEAAGQQALAFAGAEEELASAGFQTSASIEAQIIKYDRLLDFFQEDAVATAQLTQAKRNLQAQLSKTSGAQSQFGVASGQTSAFVNNLSFALNDAQQAQFGFDQFIRATSNNIGVMIGQLQGVIQQEKGFRGAMRQIRGSLVGPLGISVAFSAISTAAVLLQGAFKDTEEAGDTAANKLEESFAPLIKIVDAVRGSFEFTFEDLQAKQGPAQEAFDLTTERVGELESKLNDLLSVSAPSANISAVQKQIEEANQLLEDQEKELAAINAQLRDEEKLREQIAFLEERGFTFTKDKTAEERKAAAEEERRNNNLEKEVSELGKITEARNGLVDLLSELNAGELVQITLLEDEVANLEEALEIRKQLILEEERQRQIRERFGSDAEPAELQARGVAELDIRFNEEDTPFDRFGLQAREISDEIQSEIDAISTSLEDQLFADVEHFIVLNERLSDSIKGSLAGGVAGFGEALGDVVSGVADFSALGRSLLATLADLAGNVGGQLIAFGVAGLALRRLVANPVGAIIAGTALVALSRVARNRIQSSIDSAAGGGSQFSGTAGIPQGLNVSQGFATPVNISRPGDLEVSAGLVSSPFASRDSVSGGVGDPVTFSSEPQRLTVSLKADDPIVLPGGSLLFAIRDALEAEIELGGSGELTG